MNIENLISFIRYGIDNKKTKEKMILGAIAICAFSIFACMDGLIYDVFTQVCTICIFLLSIGFIIVLSLVSRELNIKKRILCDSIITIFTIAVFSLSGNIYLYINGISYSSLISIIPVFLALISFSVCYINVKKNKYIKKTNNPNYLNLAAFTAIGVVIGSTIMKLYADKILKYIPADALVGFLFLVIASAFAFMGAPSFLKLYYIKKLNSEGVNLNE